MSARIVKPGNWANCVHSIEPYLPSHTDLNGRHSWRCKLCEAVLAPAAIWDEYADLRRRLADQEHSWQESTAALQKTLDRAQRRLAEAGAERDANLLEAQDAWAAINYYGELIANEQEHSYYLAYREQEQRARDAEARLAEAVGLMQPVWEAIRWAIERGDGESIDAIKVETPGGQFPREYLRYYYETNGPRYDALTAPAPADGAEA